MEISIIMQPICNISNAMCECEAIYIDLQCNLHYLMMTKKCKTCPTRAIRPALQSHAYSPPPTVDKGQRRSKLAGKW